MTSLSLREGGGPGSVRVMEEGGSGLVSRKVSRSSLSASLRAVCSASGMREVAIGVMEAMSARAYSALAPAGRRREILPASDAPRIPESVVPSFNFTCTPA